jgi:hypothetical protein
MPSLLEYFEEHPLVTVLGGVATALGCGELVTAVADPFLYTGLLAVTLAGASAAGVGMIGLARWVDSALRSTPIEADSDGWLSPLAADTPSPQPDEPTILFADRILAERDADAEIALHADISYRRLN